MLENILKRDWSYKSFARYIVDLHLLLVAVLFIEYYFESLEDHLTIQLVIRVWYIILGTWLLSRTVNFTINKNVKTDKEEERCSAQVELSEKNEKVLVQYACENDMTLSAVVESALREYLQSHQELLEKHHAKTQ